MRAWPDLESSSLMLIFSCSSISWSFSTQPFLASLTRVENLLIYIMLYWLVQYTLLTAVCLYLLHYFASRDVSLSVKITSLITWILNFGLALLVPEDIFLTLQRSQGQTDQDEERRLQVQYLFLYWIVYLLTWTVIPVLQEWQDAGDLQSGDRMRRSIRSNAIFYLYLLGISIVCLLAILLLGVPNQMGLILFLKCLATMWGMLLLMVLLGYSLVQIPRTMWRNAHPKQYLSYLYHRIHEMEEQVELALREFKQVAAFISHSRKNTNNPTILSYCNASEEMVPDQLQHLLAHSQFQRVIKNDQLGYLKEYPVCLQSSIEHNRLMKRAIARVRRHKKALNLYVYQAIFYQDILQANSKNLPFRSLAKKTNFVTAFWYCKARPKLDKVAACFIGFCSFILLISQTQVFLSFDSSLLGYLLLFDNFQVIRVLAFLVIGFIVYMSNYALFRLKLADRYGLYRKQSDGPSLMFATVNFSRVGIAIVFNFFDMIKMENSVFGQLMQAPQMGLLGEWVLKGLPGILWLIVLCHYFNFWVWVANKFRLGSSYSFSSHEHSDNLPSPFLVSKKREELEESRSQMLIREVSGF